MEEIVYGNYDGLNSMDCYFNKVQLSNNNLVIPYINLAVSEHPYNPDVKPLYIDYCYFVAIDLSFLATFVNFPRSYDGKSLTIINKGKPEETIFLGGDNLDNDSVFGEMEIGCEQYFIQITRITQFSYKMWTPIRTPNFPINMNTDATERFFRGDYLPMNIKALI